MFSPLHSVRAPPPHLIVILADDLGWNDVSWNNPDMHTPNIQQLADQGIRLNNSYFHPKCSPSRAALLTGYYPHRLGLQRSGVGRYHPYGLDTEFRILPEYLAEAGYKSHLVGKWHLGYCKEEYLPNNRGFDSFFGQWSHVVDYYTRIAPVKEERKRKINKDLLKGYDLHYNDDISYEYEGVFSTDMYTAQASKTIAEHDPTTPLFLMVSYQAPHNPFSTPPNNYTRHYRHTNIGGGVDRAATVTALDAGVGRIIEELKKRNLYENSFILFSSDNGGSAKSFNIPLRGKKEQMYEGGVRVVGFVNSPLLSYRGAVHEGLVYVADWFSTLLNLAGLGHSVPEDSDSLDVFPSISSLQKSPRRRIIHVIDEDCEKGHWQAALREGKFKLIWGQSDLLKKTFGRRTSKVELYNIVKDPYEENPLSVKENAKRIANMKRIIEKNYPLARFPKHYSNVEAAFPGNNGGVFVTGWC